MAIPADFNFANEEEFRDKFLVPLLQRLGFSIVVNYHGQREFGKDIIFAEIDRFSDVVYYGLQAKYVSSVSQSDSHGLIEDCKEAFLHEFVHPHTNLRHRIARLYIANGGSFADNARENFFAGIDRSHGGCVRLLDGKTLLALDRYASANRVSSAGDLLMGIRLELSYNAQICRGIKDVVQQSLADASAKSPVVRLRVAAVSSYLTRPFVHARIDTAVVEGYWHAASGVNLWLERLTGLGSDKAEANRNILLLISNLETMSIGLSSAVDQILRDLGPLIAI